MPPSPMAASSATAASGIMMVATPPIICTTPLAWPRYCFGTSCGTAEAYAIRWNVSATARHAISG